MPRRFRSYSSNTVGLDELKLFVNEQATKPQMEQAITEWLPKVSKPGDTVFIYFTGHGGVIPPYKEGRRTCERLVSVAARLRFGRRS